MAESDSDTIRPRSKSTLLELPPEIRNSIYRYTLVDDSIIDISTYGSQEPGILSTCQQTRTEAIGIFTSKTISCSRSASTTQSN